MAPDWRNREARARGRFRVANERAATAARHSASAGTVSLICECGNEACAEPFDASFEEYEAVRRYPRRYVVARDHENPEIETVVTETPDFAIVETLAGRASRIAVETDPRAHLVGRGSEGR